jgi:hypothetical protein
MGFGGDTVGDSNRGRGGTQAEPRGVRSGLRRLPDVRWTGRRDDLPQHREPEEPYAARLGLIGVKTNGL